jgi:diguanylate cyclase (GGDEF)-like protein
MSGLFRALCNGLISQSLRADPIAYRQAVRVAAFGLSMLIWVPVFALIYTILGAPICSDIVLFGGVLLLGSMVLLHRGVAPQICGHLFTAAAFFVYSAVAYQTGGISAPVMVWFTSIPVLSVLLLGGPAGKAWTTISVLMVSAFAMADQAHFKFPHEVGAEGLRALELTGLVGLMVCVYLLVNVLKDMEYTARVALHEANTQLELQASTDGLTGIQNRHRFDYTLELEWRRHARTQQPLSLILIDADFFKSYNDAYGHLAGDQCLRAVARSLQACLRRPGDLCARFGGEEFAMILPNTDEQGALLVAEMVQEQVRLLGICHAHSPINSYVTVSMGVSTTIPSDDCSHVEFLNEVDMALYRAKDDGRHRIVQAVEIVPQVTTPTLEAGLAESI